MIALHLRFGRCREHAASGRKPPCNSWTFCGLPVCWGLDTGHNHVRTRERAESGPTTLTRFVPPNPALHPASCPQTYGECWLRRLAPEGLQANSSWRQRGKYTPEWLRRHRRARPGCARHEPWTCSPTWMPWTSGALGGPPFDPGAAWVTGGGWGSVWVRPASEAAAMMARPRARTKRRLE